MIDYDEALEQAHREARHWQHLWQQANDELEAAKQEAMRFKEHTRTLVGMIEDGMDVIGDDETFLGHCVSPYADEVDEAQRALKEVGW